MDIRALEYVRPTQDTLMYHVVRKTYHVGNICRQCLAPVPVFPDHGVGKWDPHIWYDVLYNWPSTHKISCKYLHVDQSYDGMHLFPHWTTLYVTRILSFHWRPF